MAFEAGTVVARLVLAGEGFAQGIRKAEEATEGLRTGLDRVSGTFGRLAAASGAAFAAMSAGLALVTKTGARFEESMINVGAVTGATSETLSELSNIAVETGEATIFSATQVGQAMFNLGSQGVKTAKQFRDVLAPSLDLAAATQTDVNFASKALLASIRAFGQPLSEATRFANVFSAANENSALTAEILDRALRPVGATASALGVDFEETTAILGGLINAGITAERAGTGLKTALALLLNPSKDATKELKKLGIAQKTIAKLIKTPIKLFKLFAQRGLSAAQAMKIFGTEGGPAVLAITKQIPDIEKLNKSIRGTDSAARIAAEQLKATSATFKLFGSAITSVAIRLFDGMQPAINLVVKAATEIAKKLAAWIKDNEKLAATLAIGITALTGTVAVITGLIAVTAAAAAGVVGVTVAFAGFGKILPGVTRKMLAARAGMASLAGKLGAAGLAFTLGFTLGKVMDDFIRQVFPEFSKGIDNLIGKLFGLNEEMKKVVGSSGDIATRVQTASKALIALDLPTVRVRDSMNKINTALADVGLKFRTLPRPVKDLFFAFRSGKITADEFTESLNGLTVVAQTATEASAGALLLGATDDQLTKRNEFILNAIGFLNQTLGFGAQIKTQGEEENKEKDKLIDKIGQTVNLEGKFGQAIDGVLAGTRGVGESLGVLIKQIGISIVKALVLQGIMLVIASLFGGGKEGKVGFIGKILGLSGGGVIGAQAGILPAREDRLIAVQDGESVLNREATAALGREGVDRLNAGGPGGGTTVNITQTFTSPLGFTRDGLEMLNEANQKLRRELAGGS